MRGVPDQGIPVPNFFDDLGRNRPPTGHVAQEFRNVVDRIGSAVGQQQNGGFGAPWSQLQSTSLKCADSAIARRIHQSDQTRK